MDTFGRIVAVVAAGIVSGMIGTTACNLTEALNRSRQKRTMADMRDAGRLFEEKRKAFSPMRDAWGNPMRIRVRGKHYSIRSAGRDGEFEEQEIRGIRLITSFDEDLVFIDGNFTQMPEGI